MPLKAIITHPDVIMATVGDEAVLLHAGTGIYYSLNTVGARLWCQIQAGKTSEEACEALLQEFDVDAVTLQSDVEAVLLQLAEHGLVSGS